MHQEKYIGLDIHQATISAAVTDAHGKLLITTSNEDKAVHFASAQRLYPRVDGFSVAGKCRTVLG